MTAKSQRSIIVPALIAAVAAVATIVIIVTQSGGSSGSEAAQEQQTNAEFDEFLKSFARRDADDPLALGDVNAPVVLINYSDFQCPFCAKFAETSEPKLMKKYVDKGVLRIEWRDFPYLGEESLTAAHAARAAGKQGKFWQFHRELYANQPKSNSGGIDTDFLEGIATKIGLDINQYRADVESKDVQAAVQADFQEGQSLGVSGTPTFLINSQLVVGAQPLKAFETAIEAAAEQAK